MYIGIDLGGTKTEVAVLNENGDILFRHRKPTPKDYKETLLNIKSLIDEAEQNVEHKCSIGIGIPGTISPYTKKVKNANSTWLNNQPMLEDLSALLNREIKIANDANCLAVSEAIDGAGAGYGMVFAIIIGTGCGAGLAIDGKAWSGANGNGGEWGHNSLPFMNEQDYELAKSHQCYCGNHGCIETFISGTGFARDYNFINNSNLIGKDIIERFHNNDKAAVDAVNRLIDRIARSMAHVVNMMDPDVFVLGGGLSNFDYLYDVLPKILPNKVFGKECETPIKKAIHGDSSGVRGAAWLWKNA